MSRNVQQPKKSGAKKHTHTHTNKSTIDQRQKREETHKNNISSQNNCTNDDDDDARAEHIAIHYAVLARSVLTL